MSKQFKAWKWKMDKETFLHKKNRQADKDLSDEWHLLDPHWFPPPLNRTTEEIERDMNDPTICVMDRRYVPKPGSSEELNEMTETVLKKTKRMTWVIRICVAVIITLTLKAIFGG